MGLVSKLLTQLPWIIQLPVYSICFYNLMAETVADFTTSTVTSVEAPKPQETKKIAETPVRWADLEDDAPEEPSMLEEDLERLQLPLMLMIEQQQLLAGLDPVAVLYEVVDDDGSMARLPKLRQIAEWKNLKIVSIADLIRYRRKRDKLTDLAGVAWIPTMWGPFTAYCYKSILDGIEHIVMVKGEIGDGQDILVRVNTECLTGDIFGSTRCDCGNQLGLAMKQIEAAGRGVLVYLRGHEGRGIGLGHKLHAYNLQDAGHDTVEEKKELGLPIDSTAFRPQGNCVQLTLWEVSVFSIQVERREASALSIQVERREASALPIQIERNEASALSIQIERNEASTLPIQVNGRKHRHFRFKSNGGKHRHFRFKSNGGKHRHFRFKSNGMKHQHF
ncbi:GTP cyclohydrolase II isoform 2 [Hibiscus syriacus]|uniref:GTP cyclohydrolase II isoform 2 n=1 Tax=Hibiscus syriacus TaxID=106335 RepID=A0A6A2Y3F4_HIBSY|nr:GTP cyclohydrolase II isoform 2 [Hibiscus syriacus]